MHGDGRLAPDVSEEAVGRVLRALRDAPDDVMSICRVCDRRGLPRPYGVYHHTDSFAAACSHCGEAAWTWTNQGGRGPPVARAGRRRAGPRPLPATPTPAPLPLAESRLTAARPERHLGRRHSRRHPPRDRLPLAAPAPGRCGQEDSACEVATEKAGEQGVRFPC
jgi:hypothetical protein